MAVRTNLMLNPGMEGSKFGWNGAVESGATSLSSAVKRSGSTSLLLTQNNPTARIRASVGTAQVAEMPSLKANTNYTATVWAYAPERTQGVYSYAFGADASGNATALLGTTGATVSVTPGVWTPIKCSFNSGSGNPKMYLNMYIQTGGGSGVLIYFDDALLEEGTTFGDSFDGSSVKSGFAYAWTGPANQSPSTETSGAPLTINSTYSAEGTLSTALAYTKRVSSNYSAEGTLSTHLSNYQRVNSAYSGEGTFTTSLSNYRRIHSDYSAEGTLTTALVKASAFISSDYSVEGTLATALHRNIHSDYTATGTLSTAVTYTKRIRSDYAGEGFLSTTLALPQTFLSDYTAEGILSTELVYNSRATPIENEFLGKLSTYSITTSAVSLNPADGSGATPSVSATYTRGTDPEYALGMVHNLVTGRAGDYSGEIVSVGVAANSDRVSVSTSTLLTLLNAERRVFPFIASAKSNEVPAQAVEYMTQACGVLYDAVPGNVVMYASGYGHPNGYLQGHEDDRYTSKAAAYANIDGRWMQALNGTAVLAQTPLPKNLPAFTFTQGQLAVFSTGLRVQGAGTVTWNMQDVLGTYAVSLSQSGGTVTAKLGSTTLASYAGAVGSARPALSLAKTSDTTVTAKLTVHDATGVLVYDGAPTVVGGTLPRTVGLSNVTFTGSGSYVYGTYLTVTNEHPMLLPAVQKVLRPAKRATAFVSGFHDNVWSALNEYASITRMDIRFVDGQMVFGQRNAKLSHGVPLSTLEVTAARRDKYRQVGIMNQQSKAVADNSAILWRADSVYQVATREVYETTLNTKHSILDVRNPVAVDGITPFPYKGGTGQYVVTGADGYIVSPAWWNDNGGKIEVSLTDQPGELALKITGPDTDSLTRSPYRISEGAADRPALYICGSGIINDPIQLNIATGAANAKAGFDRVLDSPFVADSLTVYETAASMARAYSSAVAEVSISEPNEYDTPSKFGKYPASSKFTDGERNFRVISATQNTSNTTMTAEPFTTIAELNASFPAGSTIKDMKSRYAGRTIRQFNIKPLKEG